MRPSAPDTICGRVRIESETIPGFGCDAFGAVMRAELTDTTENMWLTVIERELVPSAIDLSRFMAGANTLLGMRHPALIRVGLVDREADFCVIGFDALPGATSLRDTIDRGDGSPLVARVAVQLARSLAFLHKKGRVHGTLCPGNVALWEGAPMLWQYGLAELCEPARLLPAMRRLGGDVVAPEIAQGGALNGRVDIFAWGALVAALASGRTGADAVAAVQDREVQGGMLLSLVREALSPDPHARPEHGLELLERLHTQLSDEAAPVEPSVLAKEAELRELAGRYLAEVQGAGGGPGRPNFQVPTPTPVGRSTPDRQRTAQGVRVAKSFTRAATVADPAELAPTGGAFAVPDEPDPDPFATVPSEASGDDMATLVDEQPAPAVTARRVEQEAVFSPDALTPPDGTRLGEMEPPSQELPSRAPLSQRAQGLPPARRPTPTHREPTHVDVPPGPELELPPPPAPPPSHPDPAPLGADAELVLPKITASPVARITPRAPPLPPPPPPPPPGPAAAIPGLDLDQVELNEGTPGEAAFAAAQELPAPRHTPPPPANMLTSHDAGISGPVHHKLELDLDAAAASSSSARAHRPSMSGAAPYPGSSTNLARAPLGLGDETPRGPRASVMAGMVAFAATALAVGLTIPVAEQRGGVAVLMGLREPLESSPTQAAADASAESPSEQTAGGDVPPPTLKPTCPEGTVQLASRGKAAHPFCVETGEFPGLREVPRVGVTYDEALAACAQRGRRLCTVSEWRRACRGPGNNRFPYGTRHKAERCNDALGGRGQNLGRSGAREGCVTVEGVYDLVGNVEEWVEGSHAMGGDANARAPHCGTKRSPPAGFKAAALGLRCCVSLPDPDATP